MFKDFQFEPICTPTRAAFMTGRMPIRSGTDGLVMPDQTGGLDPIEVTLAEVLKGAGYLTAYLGKWHLGESSDLEPLSQGFDYWYGIHNTSFPVDPDSSGTDMELIESQKVVEGYTGKPAKNRGNLASNRHDTCNGSVYNAWKAWRWGYSNRQTY